jgi:hypothetical protein
MEWAPPAWYCEPYDPGSLVRTALGLLHDRHGAVADGRRHLSSFVASGTHQWIRYLGGHAH